MAKDDMKPIRDRFQKILDTSPQYRGKPRSALGKMFGVTGQHVGNILNLKEPLSAKIGFIVCATTGYSLDWLFLGNGQERPLVAAIDSNQELITIDVTGIPREAHQIFYDNAVTLQKIFNKAE